MARSLNIKDLVPRKNSPYKQGYYTLQNLNKYIGDPGKIIYRSAWEKTFCIFCDLNTQVIAWSSEPIRIPYQHPILNVQKPYNVDFYFKIKKTDNIIKEYIAEVKPAKKIKKPEMPPGNVTQKRLNGYIAQMQEYSINMFKFKAAQEWAIQRGWEFILITENFLY